MPSNRPEHERAFRKAKRVGAPLTLTDALTATVVRYLKDGAYVETAAAAAGIDKATLHRWLRQGKHDRDAGLEDTPHAEFCAAVEEAIARAELDDLGRVSKAAKRGNWNASAWRLERRFPKRWAAAKRFGTDGEDGDEDVNAGFRLAYSMTENDHDDEGTENGEAG